MFVFIKEKYLALLDNLDFVSSQVRRYTYDFGPIITPRSGTKTERPTTRWALAIEALIVFILLAALATYSRMAQYDAMTERLSDYFLPGLVNVSTTHDAGHYMFMANQWLLQLADGKGFLDVQQGELLGYLLATLSTALGSPLEESARLLLYASVALTAFSAYLLLTGMGQSLLGLFTAIGLIFFFPFYSRTSLGMVDTDQLNLFFVLAILWLIQRLAAATRPISLISWALAAGSLNYLFFIWYGRAGFTAVFICTIAGVLLAHRRSLARVVMASGVFLIASGTTQARTAYESLMGFILNYIHRPDPRLQNSLASETTSTELIAIKNQLFSIIGELQPISTAMIKNDYSSIVVFMACQVGIAIWLLQRWQRVFIVLPLLLFLATYFISGQRFSFYAAPLPLIGLAVSTLVVLTTLARGVSESRQTHKVGRVQHTSEREVKDKSPATVVVSLLLLIAASFSPLEIFPHPGVIPPPVIPAREITSLKAALSKTTAPYLIASWWDYGHELRYQGGGEAITDGSNPASVKNLYVARGLISTDPFIAADEIRFAAYFPETALLASFPRRPELNLAEKTDHDIYLFIPSELQHKMNLLLQLAAQTMTDEAFKGYVPSSSVFFRLYHNAPARYGPFELVSAEPRGSVIYRLPAPVPQKKP